MTNTVDDLRVRAYNVRFGDALLISVPDRYSNGITQTRHILIDVGNVLGTEGGDDTVFAPVIDDILAVLAGQPLDLYVMTHEHLDHVQGLYFAAERLGRHLNARYAWLTASAAEDYYDRFTDARKRRLEAAEAFTSIERFLEASPRSDPTARTLVKNNNPSNTSQCVQYLRTLADHTAYVHRGKELAGTHPFSEARFRLWAPEEDTSVYYGRFQPMALGVSTSDASVRLKVSDIQPPPGVDGGAFYDLVAARRSGYADNLLTIDRAANNSSVVFELEWRGWRLLFPGDAEHRSWKTIAKAEVLQPVHFLKVSHHGSATGMPPKEILDVLLPELRPDDRPRRALVSTCADSYNGVPHPETLAELERRCDEVFRVGEDVNVPYVDIEFASE